MVGNHSSMSLHCGDNNKKENKTITDSYLVKLLFLPLAWSEEEPVLFFVFFSVLRAGTLKFNAERRSTAWTGVVGYGLIDWLIDWLIVFIIEFDWLFEFYFVYENIHLRYLRYLFGSGFDGVMLFFCTDFVPFVFLFYDFISLWVYDLMISNLEQPLACMYSKNQKT